MSEGSAMEKSPLPHSKEEGGGCGKRDLVGGVGKGGGKEKSQGEGWQERERIHYQAVPFSSSYWFQAPSL